MSGSRPIVLSVEDLTVRYRLARQRMFQAAPWMTAVDHVSFKLGAGETLGLVGESGSGKSTAARAIMALQRPSAGKIKMFDRDLATLSWRELKAHRKLFQMIFQDPYGSLDPRYSVERIILEPVHGLSKPVARENAIKALQEVGMRAEDLPKYPSQFSGGQRQRIAIARALVTRPALIVADEAVSALDVSVQAQVLNLMKDLQCEHNMAYLFISHDLAVVRYICEQIVVLFRGAVVEAGRTSDVLRSPGHPYTRELIDAMPLLGARRRHMPGTASTAAMDKKRITTVSGACPYLLRCPIATSICQTSPELKTFSDGRQIACHFA
ncbi:MAG: oligopeptide/dipeptide ABC transporter ATP-binding protein [Pusillimonas sp.]